MDVKGAGNNEIDSALTLMHFDQSLGKNGKFALNQEVYNTFVVNSQDNDELQPLSVI